MAAKPVLLVTRKLPEAIEARAADEERLEWMKAGDHGRILETMPEFMKSRPEGMFGHWLMMAGATGEELNTAPGELYSKYENSIGTGQVHVWFDEPKGGFPLPKDVRLSRD